MTIREEYHHDDVKQSSKDPIPLINSSRQGYHCSQPVPGTLPKNAVDLSQAARGLLIRLLERNPQIRMRNLRQLQQSAFYMGYNFEQVKTKKVSPKSVLEKHFPADIINHNGVPDTGEELFPEFSQAVVV